MVLWDDTHNASIVMAEKNFGAPQMPSYDSLMDQAIQLEGKEDGLKLQRAKIKLQMAEVLLRDTRVDPSEADADWNEAIKQLEGANVLAIGVHSGTANDAGSQDSEVQQIRAEIKRISKDFDLRVSESGTGFGKYGDYKIEIGPKR